MDSRGARQLLVTCFPELANGWLMYLAEGWDSTVWESQVLDRYQRCHDPAWLDRASFYARTAPCHSVFYGLETRQPQMVRQGVSALVKHWPQASAGASEGSC